MLRTTRSDSASRSPVVVRLLNEFRLDIGHREVVLPGHAQRVLAYLALSRPSTTSQRRSALAERLWCDGPHHRAQASLRTALWRIRQVDDRIVHADRERVHLGSLVEVDLDRSLEQATRLMVGEGELRPGDASIGGLAGDLLPGWEEEWLVVERERVHQVRIHALVALAIRLCRLGRFVPALNAAYMAIAAEPLHEAAHAALVEVHLAEGNLVEARRQLDQYTQLLWDEMGLAPSDALLTRVRSRSAG